MDSGKEGIGVFCITSGNAPPTFDVQKSIFYKMTLIASFSSDKTAVLDLIDRCTKLQLSPEHLLDAVQDFLVQQALST